jgi:carbon-monoxide dehydrogenase medium subunit
MPVVRYLFPNTVSECLAELESQEGRARIIAGGTDLVLSIRRGEFSPEVLVDITRVPELQGLEEENGELALGAAVTHAQCASSSLVRRGASCLAEACASVGSPQIRNVATVAGNVVNAQPAADAAVALVALGATAEVVSARGKREEPVEDLYAGLGQSRVDSARELLTRIRLPLAKAGEGSAFLRFAPRRALALPILNGAAWVSLRGEQIAAARICLGPVADRPFRPRGAEEVLRGARWDDEKALEEAAQAASREANPRDSLLRGTAAYRRELARVLVWRVLAAALQRAQGR